MRRVFIVFLLVIFLAMPVHAMEFHPPEVPESGEMFLEETPQTFTQGLLKILSKAAVYINPSLQDAATICIRLILIVLLASVMRTFPGASDRLICTVCCLMIASILFKSTDTHIGLGASTVTELSDYGKLLIPVMTAALAAQGGATSSVALYAGTIAFNTVLSYLISTVLLPMTYIFLSLSAAGSIIDEELLSKIKNFIKWIMTWGLKIILYVFTAYMSITGVVSGVTDAAAVKATKLTISGLVPVVGGILSDASEGILITAGLMKNAVGVYGMLALLAVWIGPFLKIGTQYLMLKLTCGICSVFGSKKELGLIKDFSGAMGLLLAMTGTVCLLLLISTFCMMKGVG